MLAVSIVFAAFLFILFLIVGVIGGWVARDYMMNYQEVEKIHPEMYDSCLLYTSPSPRDLSTSRMPSSA